MDPTHTQDIPPGAGGSRMESQRHDGGTRDLPGSFSHYNEIKENLN